jgi:inosose dehydratase
VLDFLRATDYDGWVTFEDESPEAEHDPDEAVARNGRFIAGSLRAGR